MRDESNLDRAVADLLEMADDDWLMFGYFLAAARDHLGAADDAAAIDGAIMLARLVLTNSLMEVGDVFDTFAPWRLTVDEAVLRIRTLLSDTPLIDGVPHDAICWFSITELGSRVPAGTRARFLNSCCVCGHTALNDDDYVRVYLAVDRSKEPNAAVGGHATCLGQVMKRGFSISRDLARGQGRVFVVHRMRWPEVRPRCHICGKEISNDKSHMLLDIISSSCDLDREGCLGVHPGCLISVMAPAFQERFAWLAE